MHWLLSLVFSFTLSTSILTSTIGNGGGNGGGVMMMVNAGTPSEPYYYHEQYIDHYYNHTNNSNHVVKDSNDDTTTTTTTTTEMFWTQRYYQSDTYYSYDDHDDETSSSTTTTTAAPIIVILGGEGAIEPSTGLLYPFVTEHLAKTMKAFVLQPEHRFYGSSQPISRYDIEQSQRRNQPDPRIALLTYEQALYDAVRLLHHVAETQLNCSIIGLSGNEPFEQSPSHSTRRFDRNNGVLRELNPQYHHHVPSRHSRLCGPVLAVGGSYPGFLSAMTRIVVPTVFDIAYAASAPMKFYAQQMTTNSDTAYYDRIANVAETAVPGCSQAVRNTLLDVEYYFQHELGYVNGTMIGACPGSVPDYASTNVSIFLEEVFMMVGYTFANANMAYYPPSPNRTLPQLCHIFMDTKETTTPLERLSKFFITSLGTVNDPSCASTPSSSVSHNQQYQHDDKDDTTSTTTNSSSNGSCPCDCFNMSHQLPAGANATISSGDWSGVGTGMSGDSWDFQTCTLLIERISLGSGSMIPIRQWTEQWLQHHCANRFNQVIPQPYALNEKWHIDELFNPATTTTSTSNSSLLSPLQNNVSRILFTNGLNDGWSVSGIVSNVSDTVLALNFPNGAHHSDLSGIGPTCHDTEDIQHGYVQIQTILSQWINDVLHERKLRAATTTVTTTRTTTTT